MKTVIMILAIIILLLITYLFFLKNALKRIGNNMKIIRETDSNHLIYNEMNCRESKDLIHNAFKHSRGNLFIKTENKHSFQIMFTNELSDSDLDIERMFDEFYTLDIARTKGNTGLGLAIAKEFMERLGGSIYAEKKQNALNIILVFPAALYSA